MLDIFFTIPGQNPLGPFIPLRSYIERANEQSVFLEEVSVLGRFGGRVESPAYVVLVS